jgi:hypothetical protein
MRMLFAVATPTLILAPMINGTSNAPVCQEPASVPTAIHRIEMHSVWTRGRKSKEIGDLQYHAGKYRSIVARFGGGVKRETTIIQSAEPKHIGRTGMTWKR